MSISLVRHAVTAVAVVAAASASMFALSDPALASHSVTHAPLAVVGSAGSRLAVVASSYVRSDSSATGVVSWSDEFSGPAGARPNPQKWSYNTGGSGWGNQELENYTSATANAHMDGNGDLAIVATKASSGSCWYGSCTYQSARLYTLGKFSQQYGHIEARIKVPSGAGLWPAFWALDNNVNAAVDPAYAETDIMENVGNEPGTSYSSLHGVRPTSRMDSVLGHTLPGGASYSDGFHVFSADWTATQIVFSVDGHPFSTHAKAIHGQPWTFDQPMFLILNLAVGGIWPGTPPATTVFPATMLVDYIRVRTSAAPLVAAAVVNSAPAKGNGTAP